MVKKRKYGDEWKNVNVEKKEISQMDAVFDRFFHADEPTIVPQTTVVRNEAEPLSETTVPSQTTVVRQTIVEPVLGYLQLPNTIIDSLLPRLHPHDQLIYLRLFRLSHGFKSKTCKIGFDRLARICNLSKSAVIRSVDRLEENNLLVRLEADLGNKSKAERGNIYEIKMPQTTSALEITIVPETTIVRQTTVVQQTTYKERDDDPYKEKDHHQRETMTLYQTLTGNSWSKRDQTAYEKVMDLSLGELEEKMRTIFNRSSEPIGSFAYFAKAILEESKDKGIDSRAKLKKRLTLMWNDIRNSKVGSQDTSLSDLVHDLKMRCINEGVQWNDDIVNEVIGLH
jgi:DNA-binding Lrp family transcriptional regulator